MGKGSVEETGKRLRAMFTTKSYTSKAFREIMADAITAVKQKKLEILKARAEAKRHKKNGELRILRATGKTHVVESKIVCNKRNKEIIVGNSHYYPFRRFCNHRKKMVPSTRIGDSYQVKLHV